MSTLGQHITLPDMSPSNKMIKEHGDAMSSRTPLLRANLKLRHSKITCTNNMDGICTTNPAMVILLVMENTSGILDSPSQEPG